MEIVVVPVSEINPAPYNPRKDLQRGDPEYVKIERSLSEFDLVEPLVWNRRTGNLVGGHQRLKVLVDKGRTEVEVSVVDLSLEREKQLNLALNNVQGEWDNLKLQNLLLELEEVGVDLSVTGFDLHVVEQFKVADSEFDPEEEWEEAGMPEFSQEELLDNYIVVHFQNNEHRQEFAMLIGQKVTEKTKSLWYPYEPSATHIDKEYKVVEP